MLEAVLLLTMSIAPRGNAPPEPDCSAARVSAPTGRAPRAADGPKPSSPTLALDPLGGFLPSYTPQIVAAPQRVPVTALVDAPSHAVVERSLGGVGRIRTLELQRSKINNLLPLRQLEAVDTIVAHDTNIQALDGLEHLTTLEQLDVRGTQIASLAPLGALTKLRVLAIDDTYVQDLSPLVTHRCLEVLTASGTGVQRAGVLARLPSLKKLVLDDTKLRDLRGISRMQGLRDLSLARTKIKDITALAKLRGLRRLSIAGTAVSDIRALHGLRNLQELDITGVDVDIEDVDALVDALPYTAVHTNAYRDIIEELGGLERRVDRAMADLARAEAFLALPDRREAGLALARDVVQRLASIGDFAASEAHQARAVVSAAEPKPAAP